MPADANVHRAFRRLVEAAEATVPDLPARLAGRPEPTPDGITRQLREFAHLRAAGVAERQTLALREGAGVLRAALTPVVAGAVEVSSAELHEILRPGMASLAPWGTPDLAEAEGLGVPGFVYDLPDCFDRPRDPSGGRPSTVPVRCPDDRPLRRRARRRRGIAAGARHAARAAEPLLADGDARIWVEQAWGAIASRRRLPA